MDKRFVGLVLLLSGSALYAGDAPAMQWHKGHGTDQGDHVHYGLQTSDGGYIMAGQTREQRRRFSDMLVVKTDAEGDIEWQKIIGTDRQPDFATFVTEVSDGFIVAGALYDSDIQQRALVKFDSDGQIIWQKTYPADGNGSIRGIDETADGGIVATGYVGSGVSGYQFISDDGQGFIMKTDADGKLQWEKTLSAAPHGMRVYEVAGAYTVSGVSREGNRNFCLIKTDDSGDIQWHNNYGGDEQEDLFDSDLTKDGGYILAGHKLIIGKVSNNTDVFDFWLVKVDSDGNLQWDKTFGQPRGYDANHIRDECYGVKATCDGGYIMIGGTGDEDSYSASGHPAGRSDIWKSYVVRTDGNGNLLWEGLYGNPEGNNAGEYINLTSDGGYIIFTDTDTEGSMGGNNFGLMKIAPERKSDTIPASTIGFKVYHDNPVLKPGDKGRWDAGALGSMSVLKVGKVFHMYYEAWAVRSEIEWDAEEYESLQIGHATSKDGINWTKDPANPVLPRGVEGEWDRTGTWDPFVIYEDGLYKMWYGGGGGRKPCDWAFAVSKDGTHFEKKGRLSNLGTVEDCHVVHDTETGRYLMYYWNRNYEPIGLFLATSPTETDFDFDNAKNLKIENETYPEMYKFSQVLKNENGWHMFYADFERPHCPDSLTRYATSTNGIHWQAKNKKLLEGHDAEILKVADDLFLMYYGPRNHFDAKNCDIRLAFYNGRLSDLVVSNDDP